MHPAVRVQNVSKLYRLGAAGPSVGGRNISEQARQIAGNTARKVRRLLNPAADATEAGHWALRDVSFDVPRGEVLGVIGRNGAGKSTLLKLLSRITTPTSGRIEVRGRMGTLLEVGTGFHPELSGRENVYLSGSILGMTRKEIQAKFAAIVEFSEIGKFLDTPVKWYSSGMYVRLAFAVAAHLEPEILIVDEVLAVGDVTFQRRCTDRMTELANRGLTILFVSHNMQLVPRLCRHAVFLQHGQVLTSGDAGPVVQLYLDKLLSDARSGDLRDKPRTGDGRARFVRAQVQDVAGRPVSVFTSGDDLTVRMELESKSDLPDVHLGVAIQTLYGTKVLTGWTPEGRFPVSLAAGVNRFECRFRRADIRPGQTVLVNLTVATDAGLPIDVVENAVVLDVVGDDRHAHLSTNADQGVWVAPQEWTRG
jgi:lipopolysaccharide transport system ATP-binding protein